MLRNPVVESDWLARVIRAAVAPALEYVAIWHERDTPFRRQRVMAPDAPSRWISPWPV
jgi:adenylosuccinate lyase